MSTSLLTPGNRPSAGFIRTEDIILAVLRFLLLCKIGIRAEIILGIIAQISGRRPYNLFQKASAV